MSKVKQLECGEAACVGGGGQTGWGGQLASSRGCSSCYQLHPHPHWGLPCLGSIQNSSCAIADPCGPGVTRSSAHAWGPGGAGERWEGKACSGAVVPLGPCPLPPAPLSEWQACSEALEASSLCRCLASPQLSEQGLADLPNRCCPMQINFRLPFLLFVVAAADSSRASPLGQCLETQLGLVVPRTWGSLQGHWAPVWTACAVVASSLCVVSLG